MSLKEYERILETLKNDQEQQLEITALMERRSKLLRDTFIIPPKFSASFNSLPVEIFLRIVKCCPPLEQPRFALLNSRFRDIVYSDPSLWTYVSFLSMSTAEIRRRTFMSQAHNLHVDAQIGEGVVGLADSVKFCIGLMPRWHSLCLDAMALHDFGKHRAHPPPDLRNVRIVELLGYECTDPAAMEDVIEREQENMAGFANAWRFPNVSKLILHENAPPPGSFASISTLHLRMEFPCLSDEARLRPFIQALRRLQHLDVEFDFTGPEIYDWHFIWTSDELPVNHLKTLTVSIKRRARYTLDESNIDEEEELDSDVCNFVRALVMPKVEKISLGLFEDGQGPTTIFATVDELFPKDRGLARVKDFQLKVDPVSRKDETYLKALEHFISNVKERFPALETFRVHLPTEVFEDATLVGSEDRHKLPTLDRLRLRTSMADYAKFTWPEDEALSVPVDGEASFKRAQYGMSCLSLRTIRHEMPDVAFSLCPL